MKPRFWMNVILALPFFAGQALPQSAPRPPADLFYSERVMPVEGRPFTLYTLLVDQLEFQFVAPPAWSVRYDPNTKLINLLAPELEGGVTLKIELGQKETSAVADCEQVKARILERYQGARRLREYRRPVAGVECVGYDFERPVDRDVLALFRVIQVAFSGGNVECEMISTPAKFAQLDPLFGAFLGSLRIQRVAR